ncbi:hypothetical protein [Algoriphagus sp. Y33]|uniref:hypothetical protein n=1 Tax=Algoriphagus sp. Y33 TaxID=2772483 RepID=UPI00177FB6BE|nr:hypothetical protein [Algoriphagus sp. Y33]
MKKKQILPLLLVIAISLLGACENPDRDETGCLPLIFNNTYSYPITPGSAAWAELKSRDEMMAVQQIPENKLNGMDTGSLLESLLRLPSLLDFALSDEFQDGFDNLYEAINSFDELYSREDLNSVFLHRLDLIRPECQNIYPPMTAEGTFQNTDISLQALDMFLIQGIYLVTLNESQQINLLKKVYHSIHARRAQGFNDFSLLPAHALLGKLMILLEYEPFLTSLQEYPFLVFFCDRVPVYRPNDLNPIKIIYENAERLMD